MQTTVRTRTWITSIGACALHPLARRLLVSLFVSVSPGPPACSVCIVSYVFVVLTMRFPPLRVISSLSFALTPRPAMHIVNVRKLSPPFLLHFDFHLYQSSATVLDEHHIEDQSHVYFLIPKSPCFVFLFHFRFLVDTNYDNLITKTRIAREKESAGPGYRLPLGYSIGAQLDC